MGNIIQAGQNTVKLLLLLLYIYLFSFTKFCCPTYWFQVFLLRSLMKGSVRRHLRTVLTVFFLFFLLPCTQTHPRASQLLTRTHSYPHQPLPVPCLCYHRPITAPLLQLSQTSFCISAVFFPAFSPLPISPPIVWFIKENGGVGWGVKQALTLAWHCHAAYTPNCPIT